ALRRRCGGPHVRGGRARSGSRWRAREHRHRASGRLRADGVNTAADVSERQRAEAGAGAKSKALLFATIVCGVLAVDIFTKELVVRTIGLYQQIPIIGDYVRLTYIHNPGAAFGIEVGQHSRIVFLVLSALALIALGAMYWFTPAADRMR